MVTLGQSNPKRDFRHAKQIDPDLDAKLAGLPPGLLHEPPGAGNNLADHKVGLRAG